MFGSQLFFTHSLLSEAKELDVSKENPFPSTGEFAIYRCIKNIISGYATLFDLRQTIKDYPHGLEKTLTLCNITSPTFGTVTGPFTRTLKGWGLTPLHYAFLTGRVDVFSVLAAAGAEINNVFSYKCTSMHPDANTRSERIGTMYQNLYDANYAGVEGLDSAEMRHAYFIALIQRKKVSALFSIIERRMRAAHLWANDLKKAGTKIEYCNVTPFHLENAFAHVPAIAEIQFAMRSIPPSFQHFLEQLIAKLDALNSHALRHEDIFMHYAPKSIDIVLNKLNQLIICFRDILNHHIVADLKEAHYREHQMEIYAMKNNNYHRESRKKACMDSMCSRINHIGYWMFKEDDDADVTLQQRGEFVLSTAASVVEKDGELERECLIELAVQQLRYYAKALKDDSLNQIATVLTVQQKTLSLSQIKTALKLSAEHISHAGEACENQYQELIHTRVVPEKVLQESSAPRARM